MNYNFFCILFLCLSTSLVFAAHLHHEKVYQRVWCEKMGREMEVVLSGGSHVDCVTDKYAIDVDFAPKWQESIGQALYYAKKTNRTPGILLIKESPEDRKYLGRLI